MNFNCYSYALNLKGAPRLNPSAKGGVSPTAAFDDGIYYTRSQMAAAIKADGAALGYSVTEATEEQIQGKNLGKNQWVIMAFGAAIPPGAKSIDFFATSENGKTFDPTRPSNTYYIQNPDGSISFYMSFDYHFYRQNGNADGTFNGTWSHKPGSRNVSNVDSNGNIITDPRNASRRTVVETGTFKFTGQRYEIVYDYGEYLGAYTITAPSGSPNSY